MTKYEKLINELHQAVLGVPGTDDTGMVGDIKEVKKYQRDQNGKVMKNTIYRKIYAGIGGFGLIVLALHLIGVY